MAKITAEQVKNMTDAECLALPMSEVVAGPKALLTRVVELQGGQLTEVKAKAERKSKAQGPATVSLDTFTPKGKTESLPVLKFEGGGARPFNLGPAKIQRIIEAHERGEIVPLLERVNSGDA